MRARLIALALVASAPHALCAQAPELATFSIVACDTAAGQWGVAIESRVVAAGMIVPAARAGVGAIATQAFANVAYKTQALDLLAAGRTADEVKQEFARSDTLIERRQFAIVDARCRIATHTGSRTQPWAGSKTGRHYSAQGNILTGPEVVEAMGRAFEEAERTGKPLAERLLDALKAGQAAGGDRRGRQGAGLLVVQAGGGYAGGDDRYIDLRVEDHVEPILELERVYRVYMSVFHPLEVWQPLGSRPLAFALPRGPDVRELQCLVAMPDSLRNGVLNLETMRRVAEAQRGRGMRETGVPNDSLIAQLRATRGTCR